MLFLLNKHCRRLILVGLLVLSLSPQASAFEVGPVTLHGFINQLFVHTSENNYFGSSSNGSWEYREAGLTGFYRITNRSYFSSRVTASQISNSHGQDILSTQYAFLGFNVVSEHHLDIGLRLGDLQRAHGLYADAIDIPLNRNGVMLPQPLYYDYARKGGFKYRGAELNFSFRQPWGDLDLLLTIGRPRSQGSSDAVSRLSGFYSANSATLTSIAIYESDFVETGEVNGFSSQFKFIYTPPDYRWRFGYSRTETPGGKSILTGTSLTSGYQVVSDLSADLSVVSNYGIEYYLDNWTFTFEYGTTRSIISETVNITQPTQIPYYFLDLSYHAEGWYLQADYRFNSNWNAFVRVEAIKRLNYPIADAFKHYIDQESAIIGVGWEAFKNFKLCVEYQKHNGTAYLPPVDNPSILDYEPRWDLFGLSLTYTF